MPIQERTIRSEAIVLRHKDWGEADRMVWLFTRKVGKVQAIAKGVRKIRSRKAGHLEPFTCTNLLMARGRSFPIITQAETVDPFHNLRKSLLRIGYASYIIELLDRFTLEEEENEKLYRLLKDTLKRIDLESDPNLPVRYFEVQLLDLLGYRPELTHCVNCSSTIQAEDQYFSVSMGGVLCPRCGPKFTDATIISLDTLKYFRHFQRSSFKEAARAKLTPDLNFNLEQLLQRYFMYFLERNLNTPTFIHRVREE
ncbi:MAG: DNA repair protein RecO [Chloroflexota bacterium]|nr:MAG: DNA repair protein RecO [Chloroflexota bacterium]